MDEVQVDAVERHPVLVEGVEPRLLRAPVEAVAPAGGEASHEREVGAIERWTEMPRGGHFAALEASDLLAADVTTFFRSFRRH